MDFELCEISAKEAIDFILPLHYSGRKAPVSFAFAIKIDGTIKAPKNWTACTNFAIQITIKKIKNTMRKEIFLTSKHMPWGIMERKPLSS